LFQNESAIKIINSQKSPFWGDLEGLFYITWPIIT
jgi:hypothetical protein